MEYLTAPEESTNVMAYTKQSQTNSMTKKVNVY